MPRDKVLPVQQRHGSGGRGHLRGVQELRQGETHRGRVQQRRVAHARYLLRQDHQAGPTWIYL